MRRRLLPVAALLALACTDSSDRLMRRDVELVASYDGRLADDASLRLGARGRAAVALLETGLYSAQPPGRRRIVHTLVLTRSPEAIPILRHLARRDPDPGVRDEAASALAVLSHP